MSTSLPALRLVTVPRDSGHVDVRMGAGPLALSGAAELLRSRGHDVEEQQVEPTSSWRAELCTAFELQRQVGAEVRAARAACQVPLVLAGNCNTTVGVLAGLAEPAGRTGLLWLDAHADFNTPETDPGGFLDGHGLAMSVGRCWTAMTSGVPGFVALPEQAVVREGQRPDVDQRCTRRCRAGSGGPDRGAGEAVAADGGRRWRVLDGATREQRVATVAPAVQQMLVGGVTAA